MSLSQIIKTGCLGYLLFVGCLVLFFIVVMFWYAGGEDNNKSRPFDIVTKQGTVTLHLGMPKDSVIMLVGEPNNIRSHSEYDNDIIEVLEYNTKDRYNDLSFTFENGKLKEFRQD